MQNTYFRLGFLTKPVTSTNNNGCTEASPPKKKVNLQKFLPGFTPGFLTKRNQQTQTECLQPPASSPDRILFNTDFPDLLVAIQGHLPKESMITLALSSKCLWREIEPILKNLKQLKEILETILPYGDKQKLKGFDWTVGHSLETDEWTLTVKSVDQIVIEIKVQSGRNYADLHTQYATSPDHMPYLQRAIVINSPKGNEEEPSTTCSTSKPQEKSTQTKCSNNMLIKELNPIKVTKIKEGKKASEDHYAFAPNGQKIFYRVDYVWETLSIQQQDILKSLEQLYNGAVAKRLDQGIRANITGSFLEDNVGETKQK